MNKNILVMLIVLCLGVFIAACTTNIPDVPVDNSQNKDPIKIGIIMPLSGDIASIGESAVKASQLAVDEINADGGIDGRMLVLIPEDGKCSGKDATNAINKLVFVDKVKYIVGAGCSSETMAAAPIAEANKVVMISPVSSNPTITTMGDYIFRDYPSDSFAGKAAAEYAYDNGARKAAVMSCLSDWCVGLKDVFSQRFTELGGEITITQEFARDATDLRTHLTKVKETNPDIIYMPSYSEATIVAFKQAKDLGLTGDMFLGGDTWDDPTVHTETGTGSNGAKYFIPYVDTPEDFKNRFVAKYGTDIPISAGTTQSYDALNIFVKALQAVGDDSTKVKDYLYTVQNYEGASGTISFDENGDLATAKYAVMKIMDGKSARE